MQCSHITRIWEDSDKDTQLQKKKSNKYVCHAAQKNAKILDMRQKWGYMINWCIISKQSIQSYQALKTGLNYTLFIVKQIINSLWFIKWTHFFELDLSFNFWIIKVVKYKILLSPFNHNTGAMHLSSFSKMITLQDVARNKFCKTFTYVKPKSTFTTFTTKMSFLSWIF